jgi:hypothetical protein
MSNKEKEKMKSEKQPDRQTKRDKQLGRQTERENRQAGRHTDIERHR